MNDVLKPLTIPNAYQLDEGSPATKATRTAWQTAASEHAAACANLAATLARQLWPTAGLLVFNAADSDDGSAETSVELVFAEADKDDDLHGPLLWSSSSVKEGFAPALDTDTDTALTRALAEAVDADPDFFEYSDYAVPGGNNPLCLIMSVAIDEYAPPVTAAEAITFERLEELLTHIAPTTNPADVPGLVAVLRLEANRPERMWAWPQHRTPHDTFCKWSGMPVKNLENWADADGNNLCPDSCPGSEVQPVDNDGDI